MSKEENNYRSVEKCCAVCYFSKYNGDSSYCNHHEEYVAHWGVCDKFTSR